MNKLKTGLSGLTPSTLLVKARNLVLDMDGNANFPSPSPSLAAITAEADLLAEWIQKSQFGDRRAIEQRKEHQTKLTQLLRQLAYYVSMVANGNSGIILSSGFELSRNAEPTPPLGIPADLRALRTDFSGKVMVEWNPVANARTYMVEMSTTDPALPNTAWSIVGSTTKSRAEVTSLQPGQYYWFRVRSVGTRANGPYSDVALVMAA